MGFWNLGNKSDSHNSKGDASMSDATTSDVTKIDFGEVLDISFSAKLYSQLKDEVKSNSSVSFITSNLSRIDASCLQVLVSFMSYAKENGIKVEWPSPSDVFKEATQLTGLSETLELSN